MHLTTIFQCFFHGFSRINRGVLPLNHREKYSTLTHQLSLVFPVDHSEPSYKTAPPSQAIAHSAERPATTVRKSFFFRRQWNFA